MKRTDASGNIANHFTNGNPGSGIPATVLDETWLNNVQDEICYVIEQNGITLNGAVTTQLHAAIAAMVAGATAPDASTTVKGKIQIGTNTEQLAGTDALKAMTSAGFASAKNLAIPGYYRLPGGFVIQWGQQTNVPSGAGGGAYALPITATTQILTTITNHGGLAPAINTAGYCDTNSQIRLYHNNGIAAQVNWIVLSN